MYNNNFLKMPGNNTNEANLIMNLVALGESYDNIAKEFNKNESDIKTIVLDTICDRIEKKLGLEEYFCNEYYVSKKELDEFRRKNK
jgi:uncharacterized protein with HEPN domain